MKTINTNNTNAIATAALNLKVNHQMRTIEMTKTFADKASRFGSDEYNTLMLAREQNPGYSVKVVTRKTTKSDKPSFKGLTYEYMEKYILAHGDAETVKKNYEEFNEMLLISRCHSKQFRYPVIKSWFLKQYPEIAKFGMCSQPEIEVVGQPQEANVVLLHA